MDLVWKIANANSKTIYVGSNELVYTDYVTGPGSAISPLCVRVCLFAEKKTFELNVFDLNNWRVGFRLNTSSNIQIRMSRS